MKIQIKENQMPNNPPQPKQSYAQSVTSTPKTVQSPFLHPLTKIKLTKLNIKKIIQNFPPIPKPHNPTKQEQSKP